MKKKIICLSAVITVIVCCVVLGAFCINASADENVPELDIFACNLQFKDNVYIKYAVSAENTDNVKLLIWDEPDEKYEYGTQSDVLEKLGTEEIGEKEYLVYSYKKLSARQMTDYVYARAYTEKSGTKYYSDVVKYSILEYAYSKTGKTGTVSDNTDLVALLNSMLEYGAMAQKYTGYKTDKLANTPFYMIKLDGGVFGDSSNSGLYQNGTELDISAPATRGNDIFSAWKNSAGTVVANTANAKITVGEANETYTAVYEKAPSVGLLFDSNGNDTCEVSDIGSCTDKDIVIPAYSPDGEKVVAIAVGAFEGTSITSVSIPATVEEIGKKAFNGCDCLAKVYYDGSQTDWDSKVKDNIKAFNQPLLDAEFVFAVQEQTYTVTFVDWDDKVIKTESGIKKGGSATPPTSPVRDGYTFTGWDGNYTNVTSDVTVRATYKKNISGVAFSFTYDTAKIGEDLLVTLSVESAENAEVDGLIAYDLQYDDSIAEFVGFESYSKVLVTDSVAGNDSISNGIVNLGYREPQNANGEICKLRFRIKDSVSSGTSFDISMQASASKDRIALENITAPSCTVTISN